MDRQLRDLFHAYFIAGYNSIKQYDNHFVDGEIIATVAQFREGLISHGLTDPTPQTMGRQSARFIFNLVKQYERAIAEGDSAFIQALESLPGPRLPQMRELAVTDKTMIYICTTLKELNASSMSTAPALLQRAYGMFVETCLTCWYVTSRSVLDVVLVAAASGMPDALIKVAIATRDELRLESEKKKKKGKDATYAPDVSGAAGAAGAADADDAADAEGEEEVE